MASRQQQIPEDSKHIVSAASPSSGGAQALAPLAFDESFMGPASALETPNARESMPDSKSAADFFLDQIAAVVSDEKKLSDNIMDLIPPVEAPTSQAPAVSQATTPSAMALGLPLQPPLDLMMRALSPPTSLLPDFGDVTSLSLLGDAPTRSSVSAIATMTSVSTADTRELPVSKTALATGAIRRKAELATASSMMQKKQKTDSTTSDTVVNATTAMQQPMAHLITRQSLHMTNPPLSVAAAAAAAREKVMKEPQSGDLYECVITKRNGGLGLTLACVDDHVQITGLAPDTPAANSGICVGDTLVAVSGLPVRGLQFSTVIGRLKSTSRNSIVLKLRRNPFRQNAGNSTAFRGLKRPSRGTLTTLDSSNNSANVLSSKTLALESRLGGGLGNGLLGSTNGTTNQVHTKSTRTAGLEDVHRVPSDRESDRTNPVAGFQQLHVQAEPMNSTYYPTDASILTMGATRASARPSAPSSVLPNVSVVGWRVHAEEKERYYTECRALRHELGRAMVAQRMQARDTRKYTTQLQAVVDTFQAQVQAVSSSSSTDGAKCRAELDTLRQQLVEAKRTLATQQLEVLQLQEREARHALPEAQRIKWQLVSSVRKRALQVDCKLAVKEASNPAVATGTRSALRFEERLHGIQVCAFALIMGLGTDQPDSPTLALELDATMCTELLNWNMQDAVVQDGTRYIVSVADRLHVKYMRREEVLIVSWTFRVKDSSTTDEISNGT